MDNEENAFKSRIRALMMKNKQLDSEIEDDDSTAKKSALKDEKDKNNDELRQIRCQRFQQEQINEDVAFIKHCCQYNIRLMKFWILRLVHQKLWKKQIRSNKIICLGLYLMNAT